MTVHREPAASLEHGAEARLAERRVANSPAPRAADALREHRARLLPRSERLRSLRLDVTDPESIRAAVEESGPVDVLVNNAGVGLLGAFEATPMATIREVFETNTFGVMALTQALIPRFRERRAGVIVNVTSSATLAPMPLVAVYTASKTAVEGFTASLAHELAEFDVRVKLVEPGYCPNTRFAENGGPRMQGLLPQSYAAYAERIFASYAGQKAFTRESDVAEAVWRAANDTTGQVHFPAGAYAAALGAAR
ncbi:MAG TPA: SDR family NAD(P)-dependent oxidoreductase [Polyangiaceae bacterium]